MAIENSESEKKWDNESAFLRDSSGGLSYFKNHITVAISVRMPIRATALMRNRATTKKTDRKDEATVKQRYNQLCDELSSVDVNF